MQVLLIGSSIFEQWNNAQAGFPGATIRNCAISGTTTDFWTFCIDDILKYKLSNVVAYYCGSNDFNAGIPESKIINNTLETFTKVKKAQRTFVYYSIIKSPPKQDHFQAINRVNTALRSTIDRTDYTVDLNRCLCDNMTDIADMYQADLLHLTPTAYRTIESYNRAAFWNPYINNCRLIGL